MKKPKKIFKKLLIGFAILLAIGLLIPDSEEYFEDPVVPSESTQDETPKAETKEEPKEEIKSTETEEETKAEKKSKKEDSKKEKEPENVDPRNLEQYELDTLTGEYSLLIYRTRTSVYYDSIEDFINSNFYGGVRLSGTVEEIYNDGFVISDFGDMRVYILYDKMVTLPLSLYQDISVFGHRSREHGVRFQEKDEHGNVISNVPMVVIESSYAYEPYGGEDGSQMLEDDPANLYHFLTVLDGSWISTTSSSNYEFDSSRIFTKHDTVPEYATTVRTDSSEPTYWMISEVDYSFYMDWDNISFYLTELNPVNGQEPKTEWWVYTPSVNDGSIQDGFVHNRSAMVDGVPYMYYKPVVS